MSTFNFDLGAPIHVVRDGNSVKIRFEEDTVGFNVTSSGFSISNDWNDRHFTLSFDENSILYHLTREDIEDRKSGEGNIPPSNFAAEMYGYIRSIAPPVPEGHIDLDLVGRVDFDEFRTYLEEKGVVDGTGGNLRIDPERKKELEERLNEDPAELGKLYSQVLNPVSMDEVWDEDSGENIFAYPTASAILVLFVFPDGYIGVTTVRMIMNFASIAGGSQMIDHVLRSISDK